MAREVERFIRIERPVPKGWHTIPLGEKVRVWESSSAEADNGSRLAYFHIAFLDGLARGNRVTYLGQHFSVLEISDSKRLVGLELRCEPASAA